MPDLSSETNSVDITISQEQVKRLAICYRYILEVSRKRWQQKEETTVRGKFGEQTQTAVESATTEKPSAGIV